MAKTSATNVTFLIGNGFDIGLGLKTRYRDFIETYIKSHKQSNEYSSAVDWLKGKIAGDEKIFDKWSDAEEAFGKLEFSNSKFGVEQTLIVTLCDFEKCLMEYLSAQDDQFVVPDEQQEKLREIFLTGIVNALMTIEKKDKAPYEFNLNFITFNYTDSLEKLLGKSNSFSQTLPVISEESKGNELTVKVNVENICHVHGRVKDKTSIFGVDSIKQIADRRACEYCKNRGFLIKHEIDKKRNGSCGERAKELIKQADMIVCFGLSFGKTDQSWWKYIYRCLKGNDTRQLLILSRKATPNRLPNAYVNDQETIRNNFIHSADSDKDKDKDKVVERIRIPVISLKDPYGRQVVGDPFLLSWFGPRCIGGNQSTAKELDCIHRKAEKGRQKKSARVGGTLS